MKHDEINNIIEHFKNIDEKLLNEKNENINLKSKIKI